MTQTPRSNQIGVSFFFFCFVLFFLMQFRPRPYPHEWCKMAASPVYKEGNTLRDYQLEGVNWLTFCWCNRYMILNRWHEKLFVPLWSEMWNFFKKFHHIRTVSSNSLKIKQLKRWKIVQEFCVVGREFGYLFYLSH